MGRGWGWIWGDRGMDRRRRGGVDHHSIVVFPSWKNILLVCLFRVFFDGRRGTPLDHSIQQQTYSAEIIIVGNLSEVSEKK